MTDKQLTCREAFEKWFGAKPKMTANGRFVSLSANQMWRGWEAAWNHRMDMPDRIIDMVMQATMNNMAIKYEYNDDTNNLEATVVNPRTQIPYNEALEKLDKLISTQDLMSDNELAKLILAALGIADNNNSGATSDSSAINPYLGANSNGDVGYPTSADHIVHVHEKV